MCPCLGRFLAMHTYPLTCKVLVWDLALNIQFFLFSPGNPTLCQVPPPPPHIPKRLSSVRTVNTEKKKQAKGNESDLYQGRDLNIIKTYGILIFFSLYLIRKFTEEKAV